MAGPVCHILQYIFKPYQLIGHFQKGLEPHVDFSLTAGGHFVMLGFDIDSEPFKHQEHFRSQVLKFIHGGNREIGFLVPGFVAQVGTFVSAGVPGAFNGVDLIKRPVLRGIKADIIKNKKFGFRADINGVADTGGFEIILDFPGDEAGIPGIGFEGDGIFDVADQHQGRDFKKRVHFGGGWHRESPACRWR